MPMPPMPTKWTFTWRLRNTVFDLARGLGPAQESARARHLLQELAIGRQLAHLRSETLAVEILFLDQPRGARLHEALRVDRLVIVGRERERHQDRGLLAHGQ